jgi:hypothetical protein
VEALEEMAIAADPAIDSVDILIVPTGDTVR